MKVKTIDITGFPLDEHYEITCQKLLWTGIKYLSKIDNQDDIFKGTHGLNFKAIQNTSFFGESVKKGDTIQLHGVLETPDSLKEMEKEMSKAVNGDWTGMQHEAVIEHLRRIAKHGYDWWIDQFKDQTNRIYEIDLDKLFGDKK